MMNKKITALKNNNNNKIIKLSGESLKSLRILAHGDFAHSLQSWCRRGSSCSSERDTLGPCYFSNSVVKNSLAQFSSLFILCACVCVCVCVMAFKRFLFFLHYWSLKNASANVRLVATVFHTEKKKKNHERKSKKKKSWKKYIYTHLYINLKTLYKWVVIYKMLTLRAKKKKTKKLYTMFQEKKKRKKTI